MCKFLLNYTNICPIFEKLDNIIKQKNQNENILDNRDVPITFLK